MRKNILKKHSTKSERIVYEILKDLKIPFRHRWLISGKEVDFLIGNKVLEINGHEQDGMRNHLLANLGYIPIHINNTEVSNRESVKKLIITLCQLQTTLTDSHHSDFQ
jgi:very-short-patch-repair endonuclease